MRGEVRRQIEAIADDRESGATALLDRAIAVLRQVLAAGEDVEATARALSRAQPTMASMWNAAIEAVADHNDPGRFERFAQRVAHAPQAIARFARTLFAADGEPLTVVTLSASGSVRRVLDIVAAVRPLHVCCAESRPALEGRRLAADLAAAGVRVTCFADAALAHALPAADAVLVGADAVAADRFVNKSGTSMLAALAGLSAVPVYVVAGRDKFVSRDVESLLRFRDGAAAEVWDAAPAGIAVRNPYFEWTSLDLVTGIISDVGVLGAGMVRDVCDALDDERRRAAVERLA